MTSEAPKRRATDNVMPKADLTDPAIHTAKELRRTLRILIGLTVVLYMIVLGIGGYAFIQGKRNTKALCTIRQNAADRADTAQQFLFDHPKGIPGVSVTDINRSINAYQATVRALDDVDCPEPSIP